MKKISILLTLALCLLTCLLAGCGNDNSSAKKIGLAMPNSSESWKINGETMKAELEKNGYIVDLQFADTPEDQNTHIKKMIENKSNCIVIGAVDSDKLTEVLNEAKKESIPIIAYDRLIMNSDAVSYYATYDNEAVGDAMGEYIEAALNLKSGAGPFYIELFAGAPTDNNAHLFFSGAMKVLKPYIDKHQLIVPSGETTFEQVAIADWEAKNAKSRMEKLLSGKDSGIKLDAILAPNDNLAGGILEALASTGMAPLITGQDCDKNAIERIKKGTQTMTIHKPASVLSAKCVRMIKSVVEGTEPDINDITTYNNGVITVPAYLCTPRIIDKDNVHLVK